MVAELHLPSGLAVDRDDVEDAIAACIDGVGEISGAGTGMFGSNLDLDLRDDVNVHVLVMAIMGSLDALGVSRARLRFDGEKRWLPL